MVFETSLVIAGSSDAVWSVLVDVAHWPDWAPSVKRVEGRVALGEKLTLHDMGREFPLKVTAYVEGEGMVWSGGMLWAPWLFKGERTYTLTPVGGGVEFSMKEVYSGRLAPLITRAIPDLQPSFEAFASALKGKIEG